MISRAFTQAKSNKLLKQNIIFFIGTMAAAALNYLFYPVVGRILPPNQFGEVQVVIALSVQAASIFSIVRLIVVREVANADEATAIALTHRVQSYMRQISVILAGIGLLAAPLLAKSLQYRSVTPMILLVALVVLAVIRSPIDGYLRGRQYFSQSALADFANAGFKLILAALFALIGFGVKGVLIGVIVASLASYLFEVFAAYRAGFSRTHSASKERLTVPVIKFALKSLASVGLASMSITILVGMDTVLAKRYFSPDTAGLYSGISIISNILFYATISVTGVLFSSVKRKQSEAANRRILYYSAGLVTLAGVVGLIIFAAVPNLIIKILLGERYLPLAHVLPYAGAAMLALSLTNLLMMYCIALDTKGVGVVSFAGTLVVVICVLISHSSIEKLAVSFCIGNLLMLIIATVWMVTKHSRPQAKPA